MGVSPITRWLTILCQLVLCTRTTRDQVAGLNIHPSIRLRIEHGYTGGEPYYT